MTTSLQVTLEFRPPSEAKREPVDIERLVAIVPTAGAVYGNTSRSMMVTVEEAHRDRLVQVLSPYCTIEPFETLDPYGLGEP